MCGTLFSVWSDHPQSCWKRLLCQMLQLQFGLCFPLFSLLRWLSIYNFTPSFTASPLTPLTHLYQHIIISKLFPFLLLLRPLSCSIFSQATLNPAQIERKKKPSQPESSTPWHNHLILAILSVWESDPCTAQVKTFSLSHSINPLCSVSSIYIYNRSLCWHHNFPR